MAVQKDSHILFRWRQFKVSESTALYELNEMFKMCCRQYTGHLLIKVKQWLPFYFARGTLLTFDFRSCSFIRHPTYFYNYAVGLSRKIAKLAAICAVKC